MKPTHIFAVHPAGYLVKFILDEGEHLADAVETLVEREYRPSHGDAWPRTPEGVPICPKHGEVMAQREKQGDTWYSHKVTDEHGEVLYCRGYPGKSSPGWSVPGRRREEAHGDRQEGRQRATRTPPANVGAQTRPPTQQSAAPPPPPEPPADENMELPDFRGLALEATTDKAFDYAAFMTLKNGLYTEQEHIGRARLSLVPAWKPGAQSNRAMLAALEVYRDKRAAAEGRGEAPGEAHKFARVEAMRVYNQEIGK